MVEDGYESNHNFRDWSWVSRDGEDGNIGESRLHLATYCNLLILNDNLGLRVKIVGNMEEITLSVS